MPRDPHAPGALPPPTTTRWTAARKGAVARAVASGEVEAQWAIDTYDLTREELASWCAALARHGRGALRATHLHEYRAKNASTSKCDRLSRQPQVV